MKQLTCSDLGGPCEVLIAGQTSLEMSRNWLRHMEGAHPDEAALHHGMSQEERDVWEDDFQAKWEQATED